MSALISTALHEPKLRESATRRLLSHCERDPKTGCWLWRRAANGHGYATIRVLRRPHGSSLASRVSYTLFRDDVPDSMFVCHKCDNPSCVNPMHLFIGSQQDNMTDMKNKGRQRSVCGSESEWSKITEADVQSIRQRYAAGESGEVIATEYGLTYNAVWMAAVGKKWKHLPGACERRGRAKKSKMSDKQIREASDLNRQGHSFASLGKRYGVVSGTVHRLVTRFRKRTEAHAGTSE